MKFVILFIVLALSSSCHQKIDFKFFSNAILDSNRSPNINGIGNKHFIIGQNPAGQINVVATDLDLDTLSYSFSCSPVCTGASINSTTGVFTWSPSVGAQGVYSVNFSVSDGKATTSQAITINVTLTNDPPVFATVKDRILRTLDFNEDAIAEVVSFSATDPEGAALTYSCYILKVDDNNAAEVTSSSDACSTKTFLNFNPTAQTLTISPNNVDEGFYRIMIRSADEFNTADTIFSVSVNKSIYRFVLKMDAGYLDSFLPFIAKANNRYIVDWGDGTSGTFTSDYPTHTYNLSALGSSSECATCIEVRVGGKLETLFYWSSKPEHASVILTPPFLEAVKQIYKVFSLGDLQWGNLDYAFNEAELISFTSGFVSNSFSSASFMFTDAPKLEHVNLDGFNASNVLTAEGLRYMFARTDSLKDVLLKGMNFSGVKNLSCMFCKSNVENIDMTQMDFSTIQTFRWMFWDSLNIQKIDFSESTFGYIAAYDNAYISGDDYNLNDGERFLQMFENAIGVEVDFSLTQFNVEHFRDMFYRATFSTMKFNNTQITVKGSIYSDDMFYEVNADLVDFSNANFTNFENINHMFKSANIDTIKFNYAQFESELGGDLYHLFEYGVFNLIDFSNASFQGPISLGEMIKESNANLVDFSNATFDGISLVENMFQYTDVERIDFSNTTFINPLDLTEMFRTTRANKIKFTNANFTTDSSLNLYYFFGDLNLDLLDLSHTTFSGPFITDTMFYSSTVDYVDFSYTTFLNNINLSDLFANSMDISMISFKGANLNGISALTQSIFTGSEHVDDLDLSELVLENRNDLHNVFGSFSYIKNISFKNAQVSDGASLQSLLANTKFLETVDLQGFVGVDLAANFDDLFNGSGSSTDGPVQINLSSFDSVSSVYNSITIPIGATWANYNFDINPSATIYCDYDLAGGFGFFNDLPCSNPSTFTEYTFPAKPAF